MLKKFIFNFIAISACTYAFDNFAESKPQTSLPIVKSESLDLRDVTPVKKLADDFYVSEATLPTGEKIYFGLGKVLEKDLESYRTYYGLTSHKFLRSDSPFLRVLVSSVFYSYDIPYIKYVQGESCRYSDHSEYANMYKNFDFAATMCKISDYAAKCKATLPILSNDDDEYSITGNCSVDVSENDSSTLPVFSNDDDEYSITVNCSVDVSENDKATLPVYSDDQYSTTDSCSLYVTEKEKTTLPIYSPDEYSSLVNRLALIPSNQRGTVVRELCDMAGPMKLMEDVMSQPDCFFTYISTSPIIEPLIWDIKPNPTLKEFMEFHPNLVMTAGISLRDGASSYQIAGYSRTPHAVIDRSHKHLTLPFLGFTAVVMHDHYRKEFLHNYPTIEDMTFLESTFQSPDLEIFKKDRRWLSSLHQIKLTALMKYFK